MCNWSGVGGDGVGALSEQAWKEMIEAHPDTEEFQNFTFEYADLMEQALTKNVACFEAAVSHANLLSELQGRPKSSKPVLKTPKKKFTRGFQAQWTHRRTVTVSANLGRPLRIRSGKWEIISRLKLNSKWWRKTFNRKHFSITGTFTGIA